MNVKNIFPVSFSDLSHINFDFLLCSSGYEERASYLSSKLDLNKIKHKVVFAFNNETKIQGRKKNDSYFASQNFVILEADSDSESEILNYLRENLTHFNNRISILIDYSSMSRIWYSAILKFFAYNGKENNNVSLFFSYTTSQFVPSPKEHSYNLHIGPISGFSNLTIPQLPTALIIGLGYEKSRALGLSEYFDGETFVFYTDGELGNLYSEEVEKNNSLLLSQVKKDNICRYSINDTLDLYNQLYSLCKDLSQSYRVILASCGPKVFTLVSLIIALELKNLDVWRISAGKAAIPLNKIPDGKFSIIKMELISK